MKKFVVGVLVAVVLLGAAAAIGEWYARSRVIEEIVTGAETELGVTPDVSLGSAPVRLGLAQRELSAVTASAPEVTYEDVTVTGVTVFAERVRLAPPRTIGHVDASGTLTLESIRTLVREQMGDGTEVNLADGSVRVGLTVLGQELALALTLELSDGALSLIPSGLVLGGVETPLTDLPFGLDSAIRPIPVEFPLGDLGIETVEVRGDGVFLRVVGTDVDADAFEF